MSSSGNEALLGSWELSLHGKSAGTRELYLRVARWFVAWMVAGGRPQEASGDLLAARRQDAESWFASQRVAGLAPATLRSRWIALRNLYGWLTEEEEIDTNPMLRVKMPKANPKPVEVLTTDDLTALLKACQGTGFQDRRDMALIRYLAATGSRLAETTALDVGNIDLHRRVAYIAHRKGDKARFARFDAATATAIDRYMRVRGRHRLSDRPALWLGRDGRYTRSGIQIMIDRRAALAGIGHVHPHQLRHTFADRYLRNGGTEGDLQQLGGWESAEVMRRYGSARAVDRALAGYDVADPMSGL